MVSSSETVSDVRDNYDVRTVGSIYHRAAYICEFDKTTSTSIYYLARIGRDSTVPF